MEERLRVLSAPTGKAIYDFAFDTYSPEQHLLATELPHWYPRLTPRSVWFDERPDAATVEAALGWPVFVKGERQTRRHRKSLSIIEGPEQFRAAMEVYAKDPMREAGR
ncbi:hypothetical protein LZ198_34690 [Myxococcus sp. K15C18031901]|uniref:hypothetical protein n=1 Tax=Myxococcus dinghuensis TaxID=2906761 RepID=UPI0020A6DC56|nr:hypothetical protein [Myxococcus dinghuensis]MCP3104035.1 hypothetical protein [Myxococcus dinghuensis]